MEVERFDALVALIYQAASGRRPWRHPLDALAEAFDSPRAILTGIQCTTLRPVFRDEGGQCDARTLCDAVRSDHAEDPVLARLLQAPPGQWLFEEGGPPPDAANDAFQEWLIETCAGPLPESARTERLIGWERAPSARYCHPREEHLLPLLVCAGLAAGPGRTVFDDTILGKRAVAFLWSQAV